jgi:hypothetical protein
MTAPQINTKIYCIYGRKSYLEPLSFIEQTQIGDTAKLEDQVFQKVGKSNWLELIAFPLDAAIQVIPNEVEE